MQSSSFAYFSLPLCLSESQSINSLPALCFLTVFQGGAISILTACERPTEFAGVVLIAPLVQMNPDSATPFKVAQPLPTPPVLRLLWDEMNIPSGGVCHTYTFLFFSRQKSEQVAWAATDWLRDTSRSSPEGRWTSCRSNLPQKRSFSPTVCVCFSIGRNVFLRSKAAWTYREMQSGVETVQLRCSVFVTLGRWWKEWEKKKAEKREGNILQGHIDVQK